MEKKEKKSEEIVTMRTFARANMLCFRVLVARFWHGKIVYWVLSTNEAKQIPAQRT